MNEVDDDVWTGGRRSNELSSILLGNLSSCALPSLNDICTPFELVVTDTASKSEMCDSSVVVIVIATCLLAPLLTRDR